MKYPLNPIQNQAIHIVQGPLLIFAGAGSGKTRVITARIAHLIEDIGVPPWSILAVTFTNKAAQEMRERVREIVGFAAEQVMIKTFHASCLYILRQDGYHIEVPSHFSIYDTQDSQSLIKRIMKDLGYDAQATTPSQVLHNISRYKDSMIDPQSALANAEEEDDFSQKIMAKIYYEYEKNLQRNGALDFNDLLIKTVYLFQEHPYVLQKYQDMWQYIMVDEYQDTNHVQYLITSLLAQIHHNICVVGDDDQSIYSWRGADIKNIRDFNKDFPEAKIIKLEENYRSTNTILEAANHVIRHNRNRSDKQLWTRRQNNEPITIAILEHDDEEALWVVNTINQLSCHKNRELKQMAIFYRMNYQSRPFEEVLRRVNIPYVIYGGIRFYDRKEVKDILCLLRTIVNPDDDISLLRIINSPPRGIGKTSIENISSFAQEQQTSFWQAAKQSLKNKKIQSFCQMIVFFQEELDQINAKNQLGDYVKNVVEIAGFIKYYSETNSIENESRLQNISELINSISDHQEMDSSFDANYASELANNMGLFGDFSDQEISGIAQNPLQQSGRDLLYNYLQEIGLYTDSENPNKNENSDFVSLMTVHNAKGLEFNQVFLTGMEEGIFPHGSAISAQKENDDLEEMEEERRLCYVGITRARDKLYVSAAKSRRQYGNFFRRQPSRFINDIPLHLVDKQSSQAIYSQQKKPIPQNQEDNFYHQELASFLRQRKQSTPNNSIQINQPRITNSIEEQVSELGFRTGQRVRHETYGEGSIHRIVRNGNIVRLYVSFNGLSPVPLLERYCSLEALDA